MDYVYKKAKGVPPRLISNGASAYPRDLDYKKFRAIADEVGAYLWMDMAHTAGLIAADILKDPLPHCHVVTTTTHKTLRGPRGGMILLGEDGKNTLGVEAQNRDAPKNGAKCSTQQSFRAPRADRLCTLLLPKLSHLKKPCKTILLITKNKCKTMPERWPRLLKRRAIN